MPRKKQRLSEKTIELRREYKRVRTNYLARVRTAARAGYQVTTIKIPERITEASIRRLEAQTSKKIRQSSDIVDMLTGDLYKRGTKGRRNNKMSSSQRDMARELKRIEKQNRAYSAMTPMQQEIAYELQTIDKETIQQAMSPDIATPVLDYEVMIQNWYDRIALERPEVYQYLESKTNELLLDADAETRRRFAYAYDQHADIFPDGLPYLNKNLINIQFDHIRQVMEWAPDSEAYQDFISVYSQEVESEE